MAEIAAASPIVSLIDFSSKLLAVGYGFPAKVARAPVEIRILLSDVANINTLLDRMQSLANDQLDPNTKTTLQSLTTRGTFTTCESLLKTAEKCLETCKYADGQQLKNFGRALKWPLTECHAMPSYVYGCGPCCERNSQHSSLFGPHGRGYGPRLTRSVR